MLSATALAPMQCLVPHLSLQLANFACYPRDEVQDKETVFDIIDDRSKGELNDKLRLALVGCCHT